MLIRRAHDLRSSLRVGIAIDLEDIRADEIYTIIILETEMASIVGAQDFSPRTCP
jgi:hypothetical protein